MSTPTHHLATPDPVLSHGLPETHLSHHTHLPFQITSSSFSWLHCLYCISHCETYADMSVRRVVTVVTSAPSAPVTVAVQVNGSGYVSDIFRDLVASFSVLQGGNITVISRKCLLEPSEPNYLTCFILGKRPQDVTSLAQCAGSMCFQPPACVCQWRQM